MRLQRLEKGSVLVLKNFLIIIAVVIAFVGALSVYSKWSNSRPFFAANYYEKFTTLCPLEDRYSRKGSYDVESIQYSSDDKKIGGYTVWYPVELKTSSRMYPLIVVANASNSPAFRYEPFFERLASWGFVVIGNQDKHTGTGYSPSASLDLMLKLNGEDDNIFSGKIDIDNIGIVGYSQGGAGAINAVTRYENGSYYKTIFTGSAAHNLLSDNLGWGYDVSKITIPYFMTAGTLKQDTGENGGIGVAPLSSLIENFNAINAEIMKVRARASNADHEDMLVRTDGYMTAWMLYHLMGDEEAGKVFLGEDAEILHNQNWQDVQISN